MQWFRFYADVLNDPKVQSLDPDLFKMWVNILCMAANNGGLLPKVESSAWALRMGKDEFNNNAKKLFEAGLLDVTNKKDCSWAVHGWDKRQYVSDNSNERVKKYREKRKEMGLTCNGYINSSDTVFSRDGNNCVYCGSKKNLCIDHILPVSMGGDDDIENLATSCKSCNSGKAGRTPDMAGYSFMNKSVEKIWVEWLKNKRNVTVTVTPPEQNRTETESETESLPKESLKLKTPVINTAREGVLKKGVLDGDGTGFPHYDVQRYLGDDDLRAARAASPGWDIYHLIGVYNQGIHDGTRKPPTVPGRAFPVWCQKYTKGKRP